MSARKLSGLSARAYEHPSDHALLQALKNTAGLEVVIRKLNSWSYERILRVGLTGSYLRATPDSFPDLYGLLYAACETLDLSPAPDLYVGALPGINAVTAGVEHPLIVLSSSSIELLSSEELLFVIAHEAGHIKSGHVLYYQMAECLPFLGEMIGAATFGVGEMIGQGLQIALLRWKRMSELTADRAGLLGCQDSDVALRTLMKLAGLPAKYYSAINTEDFLAQARAFEAMDADALSRVAKWLTAIDSTHPWTVMRAKQLMAWIDAGEYEETLHAPQRIQRHLPPGVTGYCKRCGSALKGSEAFCGGCGCPLEHARASAT